MREIIFYENIIEDEACENCGADSLYWRAKRARWHFVFPIPPACGNPVFWVKATCVNREDDVLNQCRRQSDDRVRRARFF
jgi:hypothetical protein